MNDEQPTGISQNDARLIARENERQRAAGNMGAAAWIVCTILIGALIQTFSDASMLVAFGAGALIAIVPGLLVARAISH